MNSFTPGEWKYGWINGTWRVISGKTTVAWIDFWQTQECHNQKSEAEQKANASLISQAPAMFQAIKDIVDAHTLEVNETERQRRINVAVDILRAIEP